MRQGNGTDLLGMNDPRSATIGVIYVSPTDDRKSVLQGILTQDKLNRQQIVIVLPNPNKAFQRPQDFDDLKSVRRKLQREMIFIAPGGPGPAEFARQRRFPVYESLEAYTQALREGGPAEPLESAPAPEKRSRFFGGRGKSVATGAIAGAAAGAAASRMAPRDPQSTMKFEEPEADPQTGAPIASTPSPQVPSTPHMPETPNRGTLDDDDDLGPTTGPGVAGAAALGAGAGLAADRMRRTGRSSQLSRNLDDDELDNDAPSDQPTRNSKNLAQNPNAAQQGGTAASASPGIIDLQPVNQRTPGGANANRTPTRNPGKSNEPPVIVPTELDDSDVPPPTHGAGRRRSGGIGTAAIGAAGLAGAAAASQHPPAAAAAGNTGSIAAQRPPSGGPPPRPGQRNQRPRRGASRLLLLLVLLIFLLAMTLVSYAYINPSSFQSTVVQPISNLLPNAGQTTAATVTITPDSRVVTDSYVMQAVTNNPNAQQLQVSLRNLKATPNPQTRQITATGHTQTDPKAATGTLTFINGSNSSVTIAAGTAIPASNGVSYEADGSVTVPAANPGVTFGQKTVSAHALTAGTQGNLGAGAFRKPCCVAGVITVTNGRFSGGEDPRNYTFVQQSDVDAVVNPLIASLSKQAQADFSKQMAPNEQLVGAPNCTKDVATNKGEVGDQGHNVTSTSVTVSATCTGMAYDQKGTQQVAQDRLQKKAASDPGAGYALVGNVTSRVVNINRQKQNIFLLVSAQGTWAYQIGDAQKEQLAHNLAGRKLSDAQAFLNAQKGFKSATIKLNDDNDKTLPTDPAQIKIDVLSVPGSKDTPGGNPPVTGPDVTPTASSARGLISSASLKG